MTWTTQQRSKFGTLAAITAGDGPLVVLIHGVGLRAEAWGAQIAALSQNCRVIAVDMPGHGHSASLTGAPDLADFTDSIVGVLDEPAIVVGHSFGAMIALDLAVRHSDKVKGLIALNAIYRRNDAAKLAVKDRAESLDGRTVADPTATLKRWFGDDAGLAKDACEQWLLNVDPVGYRTAYNIFAKEDGPSLDALVGLKCPALFVTGDLEPNSTPDMSRNMAGLVENSRTEILKNAAHMLPMTHAPQLNGLLATFVSEVAK